MQTPAIAPVIVPFLMDGMTSLIDIIITFSVFEQSCLCIALCGYHLSVNLVLDRSGTSLPR